MKVLIVGTGPVSFLFYKSLIEKYGNKIDIYISDYNKSKNYKQSFFGPSTHFYRQGFRGLGKFWHGVLDVDLVKSLGNIEKSSYFSNFNKIDQIYFEQVPYFVPRFTNNVKTISKVDEIKNITGDSVTIRHDGFTDTYDYVFFGIGFGYTDDPLVKSGLVQRSDYASDHLIFNDTKRVKGKTTINHCSTGHFRNYWIDNIDSYSLKRTFRSALSSSVVNPKNKAIYSNDKFSVIFNLLKSGLIPQIFSSLHLRYGFPTLTNSGYNFYQLGMKNIYRFNNNDEMELNKDLFFSNDFNHLLNHLNINRNSVLSGIHLYNGYSNYNETKYVALNQKIINDERLIILTPNINCDIDSRHFTSYFMRFAEITANNLKLC
jgi:hypothetical protein